MCVAQVHVSGMRTCGTWHARMCVQDMTCTLCIQLVPLNLN